MLILALDTAGENSAVALLQDSHLLARDVIALGRGHAEKLVGQIESLMQSAGHELQELDRIAINIGPGSFTGIRVGVSAARSLSLALQKPAIGISTLEALAYEARAVHPDMASCVIMNAYHDQFYIQSFDQKNITPPHIDNVDNIIQTIKETRILIGNGASDVAQKLNSTTAILMDNQWPDIASIGRVGMEKPDNGPPSPLYLRPPDAKPQTGFALERK